MLHVLRFIHADGQFDFEVAVRAALGDAHLVELGLLWTVGGGMENHLRDDTNKKYIYKKLDCHFDARWTETW